MSAYEALAAMQGRTAVVLEAAIDDARRGDTNADAAAMHLGRRLSQLDVGGLALCFGRIDEEAPQSEEPETFYVGRRHVETPRGDPIVVDWRAPVSVPFYRATVQDPFGLKRRRRFSIEGHHLLDILDEVFDDPDSMLSGIAGGIADPLLAELERARTGEMRDIVATIQAEQDVVVRAGLDVCLVVQGGPGTGKTAVGLHRAAYLMYEHREQLTESRVLVIGPNPVFLRYISQVLPSLGETSVVQTTVPGLRGASFPVRAVEPAAVAALKGDVRMASVIERACADRLRRPTEEIVLSTRWGPVRLAPDAMCAALDAARALGRSWQLDRDAFRSSILGLMLEGLERVRPDVLATREQLAEDLRNDRSASSAIDRVWPTISAPAVVRQMLTSRAALSRAAEGILTPDEQARLRRPSVGSAASEPWTAADVPLIDEAEALISRAAAALRPHRGRRSTRPVSDGAAGARPARRRATLDDDPRRPRPSDDRVVATVMGGRARASRPAGERAGGRARDRLPGAGPDPRDGEPAAARSRAAGAPVAIGARATARHQCSCPSSGRISRQASRPSSPRSRGTGCQSR